MYEESCPEVACCHCSRLMHEYGARSHIRGRNGVNTSQDAVTQVLHYTEKMQLPNSYDCGSSRHTVRKTREHDQREYISEEAVETTAHRQQHKRQHGSQDASMRVRDAQFARHSRNNKQFARRDQMCCSTTTPLHKNEAQKNCTS